MSKSLDRIGEPKTARVHYRWEMHTSPHNSDVRVMCKAMLEFDGNVVKTAAAYWLSKSMTVTNGQDRRVFHIVSADEPLEKQPHGHAWPEVPEEFTQIER